jgi:hypothetical protein
METVRDGIERVFTVCPNCGINSPVLSQQQIGAFASLWSFGVAGLVAGVYLLSVSSILSKIAFVVGGICLVLAIVPAVLRKKLVNKAKLKWQAEHPAA